MAAAAAVEAEASDVAAKSESGEPAYATQETEAFTLEKEEEELCSADDSSDPDDLDTGDNVMLCQYDTVSNKKGTWKCIFRHGILHIDGKDMCFSRATADLQWA